MENTETYYLAGPMSGYAENNIPAFLKTKALLEKQGYKVQLPWDIEVKTNVPYQDALAEDIRIVLSPHIIGLFFMPGWSASRGAKIEALAGLMAGKKFLECHYSPKGEFFLKKISGNDIAYNIYKNSIDNA